ncbi:MULTISPECIES: hypothetical protein [Nocardia]|uniref:hypothetical protein n=1 Tax=Nocardia TaxID=1817 RepID=UPI0005C1493E|nr:MULTISPECIES: hypothetical protein [Nocardia]
MSRRTRKLVLTAHVATSVGWLGADLVVLALAVAVVASRDPDTVRGAYLAMQVSAWTVLVPLSVASLATGIVQSLGTTWGLVRHYWVLIKLVLNVVATVVLLAYTRTLAELARIAAQPTWSDDDLTVLRTPTVLIHSIGALILLVTATVLAVYKPAGVTPWWQRRAPLRAVSARAAH